MSYKLSRIFAGFIVNVTKLKEDIKGSTTFPLKKVEWFHRVNGQITLKIPPPSSNFEGPGLVAKDGDPWNGSEEYYI